MLAVQITLPPGCQDELIDRQKGKVHIAVLPIMGVMTCWNWTLELLQRVYRVWEFTRKWLSNLKFSDYRLIFTTQDEWIIVKYVMEVLSPLQYCSLWKSTMHTVPLHHIITVHNVMFDHMDGMMAGVAN